VKRNIVVTRLDSEEFRRLSDLNEEIEENGGNTESTDEKAAAGRRKLVSNASSK
jgi:hypothetical protein